VKHRAAARQTGIGARQQIDPDASLESMIGPRPFDVASLSYHMGSRGTTYIQTVNTGMPAKIRPEPARQP
jgi:hypothetical protein